MSWKKGNRLPQVTEAQAEGRTREIYEEVKQALGLPHVNVMCQVYGGFPQFLNLHWETFKPVVETRRFFELAERLRADAYTRMHNYFAIPNLGEALNELHFSEGASKELTDVIDLFQYSNPLLLLLATAQMQSFEGAIGDSSAAREQAAHPVFGLRPILIHEETAPAHVKKIYEEIKRTFSMPVVSMDCRAMARWPDFLRAYSDALKNVVDSPLYHQCQNGIRETAWALTRELPGPIELSVSTLEETGVDESDISSIVRISDMFVHGLSSLTLNISMAKIGLEGGNLSHRERPAEAASDTAGDVKSPTRAA